MELQSVASVDRLETPQSRPAKARTGVGDFFAMLSARADHGIEPNRAAEMFLAQQPSLASFSPSDVPAPMALPRESSEAFGQDRHQENHLLQNSRPDRMQDDRHPEFETASDDKIDPSHSRDVSKQSQEASYSETNQELQKGQGSAVSDPASHDTANLKDGTANPAKKEQEGSVGSVGGRSGKGERQLTGTDTESTLAQLSSKQGLLGQASPERRSLGQASTGHTHRTIESLVGSMTTHRLRDENVARAATGKGRHFHLGGESADTAVMATALTGLAGQADRTAAKKQGAHPTQVVGLQSSMKELNGNHKNAERAATGDLAGKTKKEPHLRLEEILGAVVDAKVEVKDRPTLDSEKWSVVAAKPSRREMSKSENHDSNKGDAQRDLKDAGMRLDLLKPSDRPATTQELERGVRNGLNELVKKAHVQIGSEGTATAQIRMNPDHLGFMSVDMKVEQNRVILKILVDREDVLEQMKKDLDVLRAEFGKSGLQIDSLSLKLRESFETAFQNESQDDKQEGKQFSFNSDHDRRDQSEGQHGYFESAFGESNSAGDVGVVGSVDSLGSLQGAEVSIGRPQRSSNQGYESQLVMNLRRPADQTSFRA